MTGWIQRQWYGGRAAIEQRRFDRTMRAHERRELVTVQVREQVAVVASSADVWALITDPANDPQTIGPSHVRSFVVPGTPAGEVGEVQCTVVRRPDGAWTGSLAETVERVEGVLQSVRNLSAGHGYVETATLGDGVLTWEVSAEAHPETADAVRAAWSTNLTAHLGRIAAIVAGEVPPPQTLQPFTPCDDGTPLVDLEVVATRDVAHAPEDAWALVADATAVALESADPGAVSFTVPGSRQGEVGELVAVVVAVPTGGRVVTFQQVVGLRPGRSVVLRGLSTAAEHAWEREVAVEPATGGARVTHRARIPVHQRKVAASRVSYGRGAERYLSAVEAELDGAR